MFSLTAALYVIEAYDLTTRLRLNQTECIQPRQLSGLPGILVAPLLHAGWDHLIGNTPWFLLFGFLAMAGGLGQFVAVTAVVWLTSGLGVWLISPPGSCTVGVSGVIFGWLVFLLFRGFYAASLKQVVLALVLVFFWGGILLGVLPGTPMVSWQAHLFGALGGMIAARMVARADRESPEEFVVPR